MKVWKTMDIQFSANYTGATATPQGIVKPVFTMDIGLKKELLKNKLSIGLGVTDITNARKMEIIANHQRRPATNVTRPTCLPNRVHRFSGQR